MGVVGFLSDIKAILAQLCWSLGWGGAWQKGAKRYLWGKIRVKKIFALFLFLCILFHPGRSNDHTIAVLPCLILVEDTQPGYIALEQAHWPNLIVLV